MKATAQMGGLTLLPCPFCGSAAEIVHASHIRCVNTYNCDCETRLGETAWNRRQSLESVRSEALRVPVREIMFEALEKLERALQPPPPERP